MLFEKKKTLALHGHLAGVRGIDDYGDRDTARVATIVGHGWMCSGFPCVHLGHKLAASMMFSDVSNAPDLPMPWPAFAIYVPPGVIGGAYAIAVANEALPIGERIWMISADESGSISYVPPVASLEELMTRAEALGGETAKWARLAQRLVVLVCAELAAYRPSNAPPANARPKRDKRTGEPIVWSFQLTRPVDLDLREQVRDWALGPNAGDLRALSLQSLVRGHYKTQPHGPRNSLRKWIYREPFWRGPRDAPIADRPHRIGSSGRDSDE
jgi:hypothetical protein